MSYKFAVIGGSSTCSINFPSDIKDPSVRVLEEYITFNTPFGESPPFTIFEIGNEQVITCKMHGWRAGVSRGAASLQVFSALREKGINTILAEGGVGSLHPALKPGNIIIPHDYVDFSQRKDVSLGDDFLLIMRDPLCPALRGLLISETIDLSQKNVSGEGIYAVTEGRHFESRAEIRLFSQWNIDVVGQSLAPEVYLAREIGACYAGIYLIVNYAEGISGDWSHETLQELFYSESISIGKIILNTLKKAIQSPRSCTCSTLRKPSLLKKYLR